MIISLAPCGVNRIIDADIPTCRLGKWYACLTAFAFYLSHVISSFTLSFGLFPYDWQKLTFFLMFGASCGVVVQAFRQCRYLECHCLTLDQGLTLLEMLERSFNDFI